MARPGSNPVPMIAMSVCSAQWSLRNAQKSSKGQVKNSEQNFLPKIKKFKKIEKPKDVGHFLVQEYLKILIFPHAGANIVKHGACYHVANAFLSSFELIWPHPA